MKINRVIYGVGLLLCLLPFVTPVMALGGGIALSLTGVKVPSFSRHSPLVLKISIVLTGFGMNITQVLNASGPGFIHTGLAVGFVISMGFLLGRLFRTERNTGLLISSGTAICGGSAIAAVAPVIEAKSHQISIAMAIVFILNSVSLLVFPLIGNHLGIGQELFGYWAAIAIHDTSSVVGAGAMYGEEALEVSTTVKLIRTLWIIPLTVIIGFYRKRNIKKAGKLPWFILFFVSAIVIAYLLPQFDVFFSNLSLIGRRGLVVALFLIGSGISMGEARKAGISSFLSGIILWLTIAGVSFFYLRGVFGIG